MTLSDVIDDIIKESIEKFDGSCDLKPFEGLVSMGELVDRLSIVNFKLYTLKNEVNSREDDKDFCSWAAKHDVFLCTQRSNIKNCIDAKISAMIQGSESVPETKIYG